jgi:hypothetical protein
VDDPPDYRKGRLGAMLEAAGYVFNKTTDCWIHKLQGRAISRETVAAHDEEWLARWIARK